MKSVVRLLAAALLCGAMLPGAALAGGELAQDPYETGDKLLAKKSYRTAAKYFRRALDRNDARGHYGLGRAFEATGRDVDALAQYRSFIDLAPQAGESDDAVLRARAIEERLERTTARVSELLEEGKKLIEKKKYRDAEKVLRQAISKDGPQAEVHFQLGEVYLKLEQYGKAKAEFGKARKAY